MSIAEYGRFCLPGNNEYAASPLNTGEVEVGFTEVMQNHVGSLFARGLLFGLLSWCHSDERCEIGENRVCVVTWSVRVQICQAKAAVKRRKEPPARRMVWKANMIIIYTVIHPTQAHSNARKSSHPRVNRSGLHCLFTLHALQTLSPNPQTAAALAYSQTV
jgi:hypothetical protein